MDAASYPVVKTTALDEWHQTVSQLPNQVHNMTMLQVQHQITPQLLERAEKPSKLVRYNR